MSEELSPRSLFDADFYRRSYPDVVKSGIDPFDHFCQWGWKEGRNPSPHFQTRYYLDSYPDVAASGMNPLDHFFHYGAAEGRSPAPRPFILESFQPTVSAIVPNYNHARFLKQRLESIERQTYPKINIVILDDCSDDDSRKVIEEFRRSSKRPILCDFNKSRSGSVFRQWARGLRHNPVAELVWICESDDFADPDFVESLVPHFADRSVTIAFGDIQFCNADGSHLEGMDAYREGAEPGIWRAAIKRPANEWFANAFGVNNVIANVGGCIWRQKYLTDKVWNSATNYKILGDWYLYSIIAGGGQIVYEPKAKAYFRQHGANTSVKSFKGERFYQEHQSFIEHLRQSWSIPDRTIEIFKEKVRTQYDMFYEGNEPFEDLLPGPDSNRVVDPHILMTFLGFSSGGGEVFPINLATQLDSKGVKVSVLVVESARYEKSMLNALPKSIPIYSEGEVREKGATEFIEALGATAIHSHSLNADMLFFEELRWKPTIPYIVTLHGSYEASQFSHERIRSIASNVSHFVYTADKNLTCIGDLADGRSEKMVNGMPRPWPAPGKRKEFGIPPEAFVFTLVARGIKTKGWNVSVEAFNRLKASTDKTVHLILCGDGPVTEELRNTFGDDPNITFTGYYPDVGKLYSISDCAIVPTRFSGESFPLCIIQALHAGLPVIGTDIGEIRSMIHEGSKKAGLLLPFSDDDDAFTDNLVASMSIMLDPERRIEMARAAREIGKKFEIGPVADGYLRLYRAAYQKHCLPGALPSPAVNGREREDV